MSRKTKKFFETQGIAEENIPSCSKNIEEFDAYEVPFPKSAVKGFESRRVPSLGRDVQCILGMKVQ